MYFKTFILFLKKINTYIYKLTILTSILKLFDVCNPSFKCSIYVKYS
jgi:hypothetical protein